MERKFYPENFEKFLKGHADQFKLTPSKKVWHGIYNDLHPGRRWPSVAMSMVFIFTLVIIGHLNTNNGHTPLYDVTFLHNTDVTTPVKSSQAIKTSETNNTITENNSTQNITSDNSNNEPQNTVPLLSVINNIQPSSNALSSNTGNDIKNINEGDHQNTSVQIKIETPADKMENNITKPSYTNSQDNDLSQNVKEINTEKESAVITSNTNKEKEINPSVKETKLPPQANAANIHKPKRISNITWTYYLTPSLSYRYFSDENINNSVLHKPRIGYEGGVQMSFNIIKKLQFTTGLQVNYSGYNIKANNVHPISTAIILNTATPGQYSLYSGLSNYGNTDYTNNTGGGSAKLKNYSLQASLPIGLQYVFAGNENIKFSAAAAFQPSYIFTSQAYLLSTDKKYYLTDPDIVRKWNLNTSLTTFISFSSNSLNWQIGPQVRYQLLSTYSNRYPVKEHLLNYGIRIGISKISK